MKSFPIRKEMRADIARRLTSKAVQTEVDAIDAEVSRINKLFWKQYEKNARAVSGVPSTKWAELIRIEMVRPVYSMGPRALIDSEKSEAVFEIHIDSARWRVLERQLTSEIHSKIFKHIVRKWTGYCRLSLNAGKTMPNFNGGELVEDSELVAAIKALEERVRNLLQAVDTFHTQTMTVLLSCKTSKQMQELFPEGAKLLSKPKAESKSLAPTELAASVTEMLRAGVPPVKSNPAAEI